MSKVLAIDDNPDNLISVKALLRLFISDCEIITATSGREGIRKAISDQPDTILLDIHMPEMDGFEVCRKLKILPKTANIPVVMLTAVKTNTENRIKALELGADAFLTKPINEAELAAQVKAMLRIKKAEDILRKEKKQLEEIVQQRVNELVITNEQLRIEILERKKAALEKEKFEKQLQQAQKMEAVGALAGGIAHDFNNILFPLIGFAELLKEDIPPSSNLNESVDEILHAASRAKDLIKQILSFSRQMDQVTTQTKIQTILKEATKLSKSIIPSTITITQDIDNNCKPVLADPTQVHQLIMNLVTNAFHAMQDSGGILSVILKERPFTASPLSGRNISPKRFVCLTIKDTGVGMDKSILNKIFDPYFTTKGLNKGTGLGLSVVHGIVKKLKGEIIVNSIPGKGTVFDIYLPVYQKESTDTLEFPKQALPKGEERILLVDDEAPVIKIETQMLERLGYHVISKKNSYEALSLFSSQPDNFDVIITDMTMPGLTGKQLSQKILDINPNIPIIMCTGFSDKIDQNSAEKMGIKALLKKPILLSDLAYTVKNILKKTKTCAA
ncbi:response regulator [Desulfobacula phenolica]|uniref:histidine kinase n=1 Tax=Desulfobacula phenolica TaxID=90732 RepID=A0A1H2HW97_9BACT|nr:response regulator [Desulfobacula phenolica]SDU36192.1 His Kinase A (phospho-acceptor) domain-containing protein [Desulfobacula phenolica]